MSYYNAEEKELGARVVFASKDTISQEEKLAEIPNDLFDYIIMDEVHHGKCETYLRIFRLFQPGFSLGLTATLDRMDRKDIFELYEDNLLYEMEQREAIESG